MGKGLTIGCIALFMFLTIFSLMTDRLFAAGGWCAALIMGIAELIRQS